ncbi:hypothetical protein ACEQPO_28810 [Bacillus sp. SL00103]
MKLPSAYCLIIDWRQSILYALGGEVVGRPSAELPENTTGYICPNNWYNTSI